MNREARKNDHKSVHSYWYIPGNVELMLVMEPSLQRELSLSQRHEHSCIYDACALSNNGVLCQFCIGSVYYRAQPPSSIHIYDLLSLNQPFLFTQEYYYHLLVMVCSHHCSIVLQSSKCIIHLSHLYRPPVHRFPLSTRSFDSSALLPTIPKNKRGNLSPRQRHSSGWTRGIRLAKNNHHLPLDSKIWGRVSPADCPLLIDVQSGGLTARDKQIRSPRTVWGTPRTEGLMDGKGARELFFAHDMMWA